MKTNNIILSIAAFVIAASMFAPSVKADMCNTQYGGTTECKPSDLTINKQVKYPINRDVNPFVENLTTTDPTFAADSEVSYRIIVKNGSGETFNAEVKDFLPPYMTFIAGPTGMTYDETNRTLFVKLENLIAGETRSFDIRAKIVGANAFPSGKSLFCVTNVAEVKALNRFDSDSAQACIGNGTIGVTKLPVAGFQDLAVILPFLGVGLGGVVLLKKKA